MGVLLRCLCCFSRPGRRGGDGDDDACDAAAVHRDMAVAKWAYCLLFTVVTVVTWLVRSYGDASLSATGLFAPYCRSAAATGGLSRALCSGHQVAVRFSFGTSAFFAAHALLLAWCTTDGDVRLPLHTGAWLWKLLAWAGALAGSLFLPGDAVFYYGNVARFGAGLFLVFMMVEMVAWSLDLNEALVRRDAWWAWAVLVAGAVLGFSGGVAAVAAAYYYYAASAACSLNLFFATWSLLVGVGMVAVLFVPRRLEVAGLLTSGVVFCYASYLLLSALSSQPANECVRASGVGPQWVTVVGFFLGMAAVCYSTLTLGTSPTLFNAPSSANGAIVGGGRGGRAGDEEAAAVAGGGSGGGGGWLRRGRPLPYRPDAFHLVFALAAMYVAMLFTSWQLSSRADDMWRVDKGWASMWVKLGSKWLCEALYVWAVVAPAVCVHRDFS